MAPNQTHAVRLGSGWFVSDDDAGGPFVGDKLWMYADDTWVSLAELGMEQRGSRCWVIKRAAGTTTLFGGIGCPGRRPAAGGLWILALDSSG